MAAIVFQIGVTRVSTGRTMRISDSEWIEHRLPWFISLTLDVLTFPLSFLLLSSLMTYISPISFKSRSAFLQDIGKLGIVGMLVPSVRSAFSYAG